MDLATIVGILSGTGLILWAILMGGSITIFVDIPSVLIVGGGTLAATLIAFPFDTVMQTFKVVRATVIFSLPPQEKIIQDVLVYNDLYSKQGAKALEVEIEKVKYPFLAKGLEMIVSGVKIEKINQVMQADIDNLLDRHKTGQNVLIQMGTLAPALGMVGTLIGLVQMLQTLEDPSKIGAGMAVALITTFYGAVLANMVFMPLSNKLKERSKQEKNLRTLIKEGVIAIGMREGKRFISDHMTTFLSQTDRDKVVASR